MNDEIKIELSDEDLEKVVKILRINSNSPEIFPLPNCNDIKQVVRVNTKALIGEIKQEANYLYGDGFDDYNEGYEAGIKAVLRIIDELSEKYNI